MTLTTDQQGEKQWRYTKYTYEEVFSLLIGRSKRTKVSVVHAGQSMGRRIVIRYQREGFDDTRQAVILGRSSEWYHYRLNVYAEQEGIQWVVCGTHDSCLSVPVWSVEEEKLYEEHQTRITFEELLKDGYRKMRRSEFGHNLLLGGMLCNLPEANEVAKLLKRSARFQIQRDVRKYTHRRPGRQMDLGVAS